MKETIDKLYLGIIEYDLPTPIISVSEINMQVNAASVKEGVISVTSKNDIPIKGVVYSTNEKFKIINKEFNSNNVDIRYQIDTTYSEKNDRIEGVVNIVTNGGEFSVPYEILVGQKSADTTIGNVKNIFHFTNLVQTSYDEALKLFFSDNFREVFLKDDIHLLSVYDGLMDSVNKHLALEEFLIAANKKMPVSVQVLNAVKEYKDLEEDFGDFIILSKNNWGYANLDVEIRGDFIVTDKTQVSTLDFAGSNYEFNYVIRVDKLHDGNNLGEIVFKNYNTEQIVTIKAVKSAKDNSKSIELKKYMYELEDTYIDFRLRKIPGGEWQEKSLDLIRRIRNINDDSMFIKLFLAQIYITKGLESEASWLIENVAEELIEKRNENVELYCYYLYIRTIERRDPDFTSEMLKKIKQYYSEGHDNWKLLWILLYLDEAYDTNISLKLTRIKEQYVNGMRTPLMYFEALSVFAEYPEYLRIINDFELQVLIFGAKHNAIGKKLSKQLSELMMKEKKFNRQLFRVMEHLYRMYEDKSVLESLVQMLIRTNKNDKKYFYWYNLAVQNGVKVTGLYEYFLHTLPDDYDELIPQVILLYFTYNDMNDQSGIMAGRSISSRRLALLYRNVIEHKNEISNIYNMYEKQMELFAIDGILNGKIDENYSVIYKEFLRQSIVDEHMAENLPEIINTYMVECNNPYIKELVVFHKELKDGKVYPVIGNKAFVTMYTEDAVVVYVDLFGNRYVGEEHGKITRLLELDDFMQLCFDTSVKNDGILLYFCDKYLSYGIKNANSALILKFVSTLESIKDKYKLLVEKQIVDYYALNYDGDVVDSYLESVDITNLSNESKIKIIELLVVRGMFERAFLLMKEFGYGNIEPARVMKCCSKLIERGAEPSDELTQMAVFAYKKGKYNENTLRYISENYNATTKEMLDVWKSCNSFECQSRELDERVISQILFTRECSSVIGKIFDSYCRKGASHKVKKAVLVRKAYDYFTKEAVIDEVIFEHIKKEILQNEDLIDICKLAYIKHCSEKDNLDEIEVELCRNIIETMCAKGKKFKFYRDFSKYFELPDSMADKFIVEYKTTPDNRVFIHYIVEKGDLEKQSYTVKEMREICQGVYTFEYVMFYGETFKYYISEEGFEEKIVSESKNIFIGEEESIKDDTRYGMLNSMMLCREMGEDTTLEELAADFYAAIKLNEEMFEIK